MSFEKKVFVLREQCHLDFLLSVLATAWRSQSLAGHPLAITVTETKRSLDQNAAQWPILTAWSEQVEWQINGRATKLTPEDWKDILTATFLHEPGRIAPGLEGGMVLLGSRTRDFTVRQFSEWLEFLHAASAAKGVNLDRREDIEDEGRMTA